MYGFVDVLKIQPFLFVLKFIYSFKPNITVRITQKIKKTLVLLMKQK
jgi:hypothetical protein